MNIKIQFDGGCKPTNPGNKYGSYSVWLDSKLIHTELRFNLGHGTNNEAEFEALLKALAWTCYSLTKAGIDPQIYSLQLVTDSTIVQGRISGQNKSRKTEPQQRMFNLNERCQLQLSRFKDFKIEWASRELNVATFGH